METLSVKEAAQVLIIHPKTLYGIINSGAIPAARVGRSYVMKRIDVDRYLTQVTEAQTRRRMSLPKFSPKITRPQL